MPELWQNLSGTTQDILILLALLLPGIALGIIVIRGYRPWDMIRALLWRYRGTNLLFVILMGLSVGSGTALIAQEKAIRVGMANAAYKPIPQLVVAPDSEMVLNPNAVAIRLHGLKQHLEKGHEVEMTVGLSRENEQFHLAFHVQIEAANAKQHSHAGHQH